MPCLPCLIRESLVAHFSIIFHIDQAAVTQEPGNGPVIQVHFCQPDSVHVAVHMGSEPEDPSIVIPDVLPIDEPDDLSL